MLAADKHLLKINGTIVRNPDPDSWSPTHNPTWTEGSGRVSSGLAVGSIKYYKWSLPLSWTNIPIDDEATIEKLVESAGDYFKVVFFHRNEYIEITAYAGVITPSGLVNTGSGIYYSKCTLTLVER